MKSSALLALTRLVLWTVLILFVCCLWIALRT